jgi:hypothetical protein
VEALSGGRIVADHWLSEAHPVRAAVLHRARIVVLALLAVREVIVAIAVGARPDRSEARLLLVADDPGARVTVGTVRALHHL